MVVIAFYKPKGLTIEQGSAPTHGHGGRKRTLNDVLTELEAVHEPSGRISAVGRLDKDTTGLLLFTDDGHLNEQVLRPGTFLKVYEATVKLREPSKCSDLQIRKLLDGLQLPDGFACADSAEVISHWVEQPTAWRLRTGPHNAKRATKHARRDSQCGLASVSRPADTVSSEPSNGQVGPSDPQVTPNDQQVAPTNVYVVRISIGIGRNRIVRRLLAAAGLPVFELHRRRIGPLVLEAGVSAEAERVSDSIVLAISEPGMAMRLTDAQETVLRASMAATEPAI